MVTSAITKASLMAATGVAIGALGLALAEPAHAIGFTGSYTPANFTLTNTNADGFVTTFGAPDAPDFITLTGGNNVPFPGENGNGRGTPGSTTFLTTAAAAGLVSFDWGYVTEDLFNGPRDPFGFSLNGSFTQLAGDGRFESGTASFNVALGDIFGFEVKTVDNELGRATATIFNFSAPEPVSTPEPIPTPALLPGLIGMGVAALRKRKEEALAEASEQA